ncbi:MAG: hypothetical protein ABIR96_08250 [Bdellovibrionota bacterium]
MICTRKLLLSLSLGTAFASSAFAAASKAEQIATLKKQIHFLDATGNSASKALKVAELNELLAASALKPTAFSPAETAKIMRKDIGAVVGVEPENDEEAEAEVKLPSQPGLTTASNTDKPLDVDAPWYDDVIETLKNWDSYSKSVQKELAYKIYNVIHAFPGTVRGASETPPAPVATPVPAPASTIGVDGIPLITVSKSARSGDLKKDRTKNIEGYIEKKSGFKFSPHLKSELGKISTTLLEDLDAGDQNPDSAYAKLGELQELYRGADAVTPVRDMNFDTIGWLSAPSVDVAYPKKGGGFEYGGFPLDKTRLCEKSVFVDTQGRSLKRSCDEDHRFNVKQMTSLSKAYNKLSDPDDKKLFWTAFMGCTGYQEVGTAWAMGKNKKVVPLPAGTNIKEISMKRLVLSQDPEDPSSWKSTYGFGDDGFNQLAAFQKNPGYASGFDPNGGNLYPCVKKWNADFPDLAVPEQTHKRTNGSPVSGYDLKALRKLLVAKQQKFNRYCGTSKLFSNFAAQAAASLHDGGPSGPACVSPFNKFYNHFGSNMCTSGAVTACMGKFVDYSTNTVKVGFMNAAMVHYRNSMRNPTSPQPASVPSPKKH